MRAFFLFLFLSFAAAFSAQSPLPYAQKGMCLDIVKDIVAGQTVSSRNLVVKDFDNDGFDDVLIANHATSQLVMYKNNNGTGFTASNIAALTNSFVAYNSIDAGYFDSDNKLDIAVNFNNKVYLYQNNGNMNFGGAPAYFVNYAPFGLYKDSISYMKVGNLNNDGLDDIFIVTSYTTLPNGMRWLGIRNTSNGTAGNFSLTVDAFSAITPTVSFKGIDTVGITVGDYDTDGKNDIVINAKMFNSKMFVIQNTSTNGGTLALTTKSIDVSFASTTVTTMGSMLADIDGDSKNDLIVLSRARTLGPTLEGFAYFPYVSNSTAMTNFSNLAINNVNNQLCNSISFGSPLTTIASGGEIADFTITDIDNDGLKDIIAINNNYFIIHLQNPLPHSIPLTFNTAFELIGLPPGTTPANLTHGNFDKNNLPDFFFKPNYNQGKAGVIPNFSYKYSSVGISTTVCQGKDAQLTVSLVPTGTTTPPSQNVNWYKGSNTTTPVGSSIPYFTNVAGTYWSKIDLAFPSGNGNCALAPKSGLIDSVFVKTIPNPSITLSSSVSVVCPGTPANFTVTSTGSNNVSYQWYLNGTAFSTSSVLITNPANNNIEMYVVNATDVITQCVASETVFVNSYTVNQNSILASKNPVCLGDSTQLSFPGASIYHWQTFRADSANPTIYVKPSTPIDIGLTFIDGNGCKDFRTARINIDAICDIKIYNSVTPNGDFTNDIWHIDNIVRFPDNHVTIYNRWGMKIFDTKGYDNVYKYWPSKEEKENLAPSTYFYVLDLGNGSKPLKGYIELIK